MIDFNFDDVRLGEFEDFSQSFLDVMNNWFEVWSGEGDYIDFQIEVAHKLEDKENYVLFMLAKLGAITKGNTVEDFNEYLKQDNICDLSERYCKQNMDEYLAFTFLTFCDEKDLWDKTSNKKYNKIKKYYLHKNDLLQ